ncbi:MAG: hypothetical protein H7841_13780 [Magnetospirillum sp. WYHS-4]
MKVRLAGALLALLLGALPARAGSPEVWVAPNIPEKAANAVRRAVPLILDKARSRLEAMSQSLAPVKRIEVVPGSDRNGRYVGWKSGDEGILRIALASFLDDRPDFTGHALALAVAGRHGRLRPDDPYLRRLRGKTLVGSVYPDVKNEPFFAAMEKAFALAERLPPAQRKAFDAIDAIHYVPHSQHFLKGGTVDSVAGFYSQALGEPGNRMVFIRRGIQWTSEMGLLLLLVHEGTHVLQHGVIERAERNGGDADMVAAWHGREKDDRGIAKRMRFECEAVANEIHAAVALDAPPELIEESQYVKLCDNARVLLAQWRDRRLKEGIDKTRGR